MDLKVEHGVGGGPGGMKSESLRVSIPLRRRLREPLLETAHKSRRRFREPLPPMTLRIPCSRKAPSLPVRASAISCLARRPRTQCSPACTVGIQHHSNASSTPQGNHTRPASKIPMGRLHYSTNVHNSTSRTKAYHSSDALCTYEVSQTCGPEKQSNRYTQGVVVDGASDTKLPVVGGFPYWVPYGGPGGDDFFRVVFVDTSGAEGFSERAEGTSRANAAEGEFIVRELLAPILDAKRFFGLCGLLRGRTRVARKPEVRLPDALKKASAKRRFCRCLR